MTKRPAQLAEGELQRLFGAGLRAARLRHDITQDELVAASGKSRSHISRIESGEVNLTFETANKLAAAVGLTFLDLMMMREGPAEVPDEPRPRGRRKRAPRPVSGPLPTTKGSLALELPAWQAFEVATLAAEKFGRPLHLIDPETREIKAVVPASRNVR